MVDPTFSFGGIASGLDTNSIIDQLMALERQPISRFESQQNELRQVDDAWSTVVGKLSAFRSGLDELRRPGSLSSLSTASSSDEDAVTVTGSSGGEPGSLSFTVQSLAARHRLAFDETFVSPTDAVSAGSITLFDETGGTVGTVTTDGNQTLQDLADQISDLGVGVQAQVLKVTETDHQLVLSATDTGASGQFSMTSSIAELSTQSLLSTGTDAQLTMGALTITRASNTIDDLLDGAIIELNATTVSDVTVTVEQDLDAAVEAVRGLVDSANGVLDQLATDTRYDPETEEAGILQGDSLARSIGFDLRQAFTELVGTGDIDYASEVGISLTRDGRISFDEATLRDALLADPDGVEAFFASALTGDDGASLTFAGSDAIDGNVSFTVSQAATVAAATGASYSPPVGAPTTFSVTTPDGTSVSITVDEGMTASEAVARIRAALDAAGDDSLVVGYEQIGTVTNGKDKGDPIHGLTFASAGYGSKSSFTISGYGADLDGTYAGTDVIADFGEGPVTGSGRSVTGDGAASGLTLEITGGLGAYDVSYGSGISGILDEFLSSLEGADGRVQLRRDTISGAISDFDDQISAFETRLGLREATLRSKFTGLETALSQLQSQGQWLAGALGGL